MKCRYVAGMVVLLLCLAAAAAQAQYYSYLPPDEGPVFRLGIGPSFFQNGWLTQFTAPGLLPGGPVPSTVHFDTGLAFDAAFGWAFNKYAAVDFETGFIGAKISSVPGYISDNARLYNVPFLVNFTLSYPIPRTIVTPYIGAGLGGADVVFDTDSFSQNSTGYTVYNSEDDVVFAGQLFAGLRFQFSRDFSLDLGYKYFTTGNPTFSYSPSPSAPVNANLSIGFNGVQTHSILIGLMWKF